MDFSKNAKYADAKILIVDDEKGNIRILKRMLNSVGYGNVTSTSDGQTVSEIYQNDPPDLILLDIKMPHFSGFDVMHSLKAIEKNNYLPILVLTAQYDQSTKLKALEAGAKDFVHKPFEISEILARIENILEVRLLHNSIRDENRTLEEMVQDRTAELQKSRMEVIHRLGRAAEFRDNETGMHVIRMSKFCERMALASGMTKPEAKLILHASPMHDIGKIGIPDQILLKPGPLTTEEWAVMKTHPEIGALLLSGSDSDVIQMAEVIAYCHHEHWQGSGYPRGLKGEEIPLIGRIVTLCDIFDALTSDRPYKKAWTVMAAVEEIKKLRGTVLDPHLVDLFLELLPDFMGIALQFLDNDDDLTRFHPTLTPSAIPLQASM